MRLFGKFWVSSKNMSRFEKINQLNLKNSNQGTIWSTTYIADLVTKCILNVLYLEEPLITLHFQIRAVYEQFAKLAYDPEKRKRANPREMWVQLERSMPYEGSIYCDVPPWPTSVRVLVSKAPSNTAPCMVTKLHNILINWKIFVCHFPPIVMYSMSAY